RAYTANRATAHDLALEASFIAGAIRALAEQGPWSGTATELLGKLSGLADDVIKKSRGWPSTPRALSGALRRAAPNLRAVGVEVDFDRAAGGQRRRMIRVRSVGDSTVPTAPAVPTGGAGIGGGTGRDGRDNQTPTFSGQGRLGL